MEQEPPLELTEHNVESYFIQTVLPHLPDGTTFVDALEVTELTFVNWVFAVTLQGEMQDPTRLFLKQSRNHIKIYEDMQRPAERIETEAKVITFLNTVIPGTVPEIVYFDRPNHTLALTDIQRHGSQMFSELRAGRAYPEAGKDLGTSIGNLQIATLGMTRADILGDEPTEADSSMSAGLTFRAKPAQETYPELTTEILENSDGGPKGFVLADLSSKNIFIEGHNARFLDFERTFIGDLAHDPAYLFAHLLVEIEPEYINQSIEFIDNFMSGYIAQLNEGLSEVQIERLQNQVVRFLGITLLHRTRGEYFVIDVGEDKDLWQRRAEAFMQDKESTSVVHAIKSVLDISS